MATLTCSAVSGSDYITITIEDYTYYEYTRKFVLYLYSGDETIDSGTKTVSSGLIGSSTNYTFDGLDSDTDYQILILVYIYDDDESTYVLKTSLSLDASTTSDVTPEIWDTSGSYLQGTVTITTSVYCEDEDATFYVIVANSGGSTIYDYTRSSSRDDIYVDIEVSFSFTITGSYQIFYVYLNSSVSTSDYYDRQSVRVYLPTRQYFSWDSNVLLDSESDITDDPINSGDLISDYLTVKKWTLLQECVNDLYNTINGTTYGFTTVTTSTAISADIFNEIRSALKGVGVKTANLPSAVSSGDAIAASLFNKLQSACNSVSIT